MVSVTPPRIRKASRRAFDLTLGINGAALTTASFSGQDVGVRVQSIGTNGDSAKLIGTFVNVVPSPSAIGVGCLGTVGLLLRRRRTSKR